MTVRRGFGEWADIVGDPVVATALLDRLLHHAVVIPIEGNSYRPREHAGLFRQPADLPGGLRQGQAAGLRGFRAGLIRHKLCQDLKGLVELVLIDEACHHLQGGGGSGALEALE